jgi:hypothetical protein
VIALEKLLNFWLCAFINLTKGIYPSRIHSHKAPHKPFNPLYLSPSPKSKCFLPFLVLQLSFAHLRVRESERKKVSRWMSTAWPVSISLDGRAKNVSLSRARNAISEISITTHFSVHSSALKRDYMKEDLIFLSCNVGGRTGDVERQKTHNRQQKKCVLRRIYFSMIHKKETSFCWHGVLRLKVAKCWKNNRKGKDLKQNWCGLWKNRSFCLFRFFLVLRLFCYLKYFWNLIRRFKLLDFLSF